MQDNIQVAIALVHQIDQFEAQLKEKREELRTALRGAKPVIPGKQRRTRKPNKGPGINVSAAVIALVNRQGGLTAVQIMDKLGLREKEDAVRAALKTAKTRGTHTSVDKKWYPLAAQVRAVEQKENPAGVVPNGVRHVVTEADVNPSVVPPPVE